MVEALCYHEALRRLGYTPDEIYVGLTDGKMYVILKTTDAARRFVMTAGLLSDVSPENFKMEWRRSCDIWNRSPNSELMSVFARSFVYANAFDFTAALLAKGFDRHMGKARSN